MVENRKASRVAVMGQTNNQVKRGAIVGLMLLGVLAVGAVGAVYGLSYQTARSLTIGNVTGRMSYRTGLLGHAEFDVSVSVSNAGVLDTTVNQVKFSLTIDSHIPLSSVQAQSTTIVPGQSLQYTLSFTSYDQSALQYISQGGSHQVTVSMTAWSSAGLYSGWVTVSSGSNWNWGTAS